MAKGSGPKNHSVRKKPHEEFADQLVAMLEKGVAPWQKSWKAGEYHSPFNPVSGTIYRGVNRLMLSSFDMADPRWMTFKQAGEKGYRVKAGAKAKPVEYWQWTDEVDRKDKDGNIIYGSDGKPEKETVELARPRVYYFSVFHASQLETEDREPIPAYEAPPIEWNPHEKAEAILNSSGASIAHDQRDRAYYSPMRDEIHLPYRENFSSAGDYYNTALHELGHWACSKRRLDMEGGVFGTESYAREELRVELSSWMICQDLGLDFEPENSAAYIAHWVTFIKEDPYEIVRACRDAEKIKNYVLNLERGLNHSDPFIFSDLITSPLETVVAAQSTSSTAGGGHVELERQTADASGRVAIESLEQAAHQIMETISSPSFQAFPKRGVDRLLDLVGETRELVLAADSKYQDFFELVENVCRENSEQLHLSERDAAFEATLGNKVLQIIAASRQLGLPDLPFSFQPDSGPALHPFQAVGLRSAHPGDKPSDLLLGGNPVTHLGLVGRNEKPIVFAVADSNTKEVLSSFVHEDNARAFVEAINAEAIELMPTQYLKPTFADEKIFLNVPYSEKNQAKANGATWGKEAKSWCARPGANLNLLAKWLPKDQELSQSPEIPERASELAAEIVYLSVPFKEKNQAKAAGAKWDAKAKLWTAPVGADLAKLAQWVPEKEPAPEPAANPEVEFAEVLRGLGFKLDGLPVMTGSIHRVPVIDGKAGAKDGAYMAYGDGVPNGWAVNHKTGEQLKWVASGHTLTDDQKAALQAQAAQQRREHQKEIEKRHEEACGRIFNKLLESNCVPATADHPYLKAKGVHSYGLFQDQQNNLMVVGIDLDKSHFLNNDSKAKTAPKTPSELTLHNHIQTLQTISPDGEKRFESGAKKSGAMFLIGDNQFRKIYFDQKQPKSLFQEFEPKPEILLAEGYATAASLYKATGLPVAVAFDAGNLKPVAEALKRKFPEAALTICADHDHTRKVNVGLEKAYETARAVGARVIFPQFTDEEKAQGLTDFNDLAQSRGIFEVTKQVSPRHRPELASAKPTPGQPSQSGGLSL